MQNVFAIGYSGIIKKAECYFIFSELGLWCVFHANCVYFTFDSRVDCTQFLQTHMAHTVPMKSEKIYRNDPGHLFTNL